MQLPAIFPSHYEVYLVGGYIRDAEAARLAGVEAKPSKDLDFTVVGPRSLDEMREVLADLGFHEVAHKPETFTSRVVVPETLPQLREQAKVVDFVVARSESSASNGRVPDHVEVGTLETDLARRDFTINAMARQVTPSGLGPLIDQHYGMADLEDRKLRFVGDPMTRLREDALRLLRALRFQLVKGFDMTAPTWWAVTSPEASRLLLAPDESKAGGRIISVDQVFVEMEQMLRHDTVGTLNLLASLPDHLQRALFADGLRLAPTTSAKPRHPQT